MPSGKPSMPTAGRPPSRAGPRHFVAPPLGTTTAWLRSLLQDWVTFLDYSWEDAESGRIHYHAEGKKLGCRFKRGDIPAHYVLSADPIPTVVENNVHPDVASPPPLPVPVLPEPLLDLIEMAMANERGPLDHEKRAQDISWGLRGGNWGGLLTADLRYAGLRDEDWESDETDSSWWASLASELTAQRPLTWRMQNNFSGLQRRETARLQLSGDYWNYLRAYHESALFRSFCESYPQIGLWLAQIWEIGKFDQAGCASMEYCLKQGMPVILKILCLSGHVGVAKLTAKIPPDFLTEQVWRQISKLPREQPAKVTSLLNLPGSLPAPLFAAVSESKIPIPYPILRAIQLEFLQFNNPFDVNVSCVNVAACPIYQFWLAAPRLLAQLPESYCRKIAHQRPRVMTLQELGVFVKSIAPKPRYYRRRIPGNQWIRSLSELHEISSIGKRFANCIAHDPMYWVEGIRAGKRALYWVRLYSEEALMSMVSTAAGAWVIEEIRGPENALVSDRLKQFILDWAASDGVSQRDEDHL